MGGHGDFRPDNVSNYRFRKPNSIRNVRLLSVEPMSSGINSLIPIPRTVLYWVWGGGINFVLHFSNNSSPAEQTES
jgi:hypothetical protein